MIATSDLEQPTGVNHTEHNQPKSIAPFLSLMQAWDDTRAPQQVKPMFDWFNGSCNNGPLLLLSHACVHTMLQTEEGSNKVYGKKMLQICEVVRVSLTSVSGVFLISKIFFFLSSSDVLDRLELVYISAQLKGMRQMLLLYR